jgi:hypothetical protein
VRCVSLAQIQDISKDWRRLNIQFRWGDVQGTLASCARFLELQGPKQRTHTVKVMFLRLANSSIQTTLRWKMGMCLSSYRKVVLSGHQTTMPTWDCTSFLLRRLLQRCILLKIRSSSCNSNRTTDRDFSLQHCVSYVHIRSHPVESALFFLELAGYVFFKSKWLSKLAMLLFTSYASAILGGALVSTFLYLPPDNHYRSVQRQQRHDLSEISDPVSTRYQGKPSLHYCFGVDDLEILKGSCASVGAAQTCIEVDL